MKVLLALAMVGDEAAGWHPFTALFRRVSRQRRHHPARRLLCGGGGRNTLARARGPSHRDRAQRRHDRVVQRH